MVMFDHKFQPISFISSGPIGNKFGWVFMVAEIDEVWFLKWKSPNGEKGMTLFSNQEDLLKTIENINTYPPDIF